MNRIGEIKKRIYYLATMWWWWGVKSPSYVVSTGCLVNVKRKENLVAIAVLLMKPYKKALLFFAGYLQKLFCSAIHTKGEGCSFHFLYEKKGVKIKQICFQ